MDVPWALRARVPWESMPQSAAFWMKEPVGVAGGEADGLALGDDVGDGLGFAFGAGGARRL